MMPMRFIAVVVVTGVAAACANRQTVMTGGHSGPAMNYHVIDDRLATGGHFVGDGLEQIRDRGVRVVIDLRDEPPDGQKERLAAQGIEWVSVPVSWENPQPADFGRFVAAMDANRSANLFVQCGANYRASAMTYLYQVLVEGVPEAAAASEMHAVWQPNDTWSHYIELIKTE